MAPITLALADRAIGLPMIVVGVIPSFAWRRIARDTFRIEIARRRRGLAAARPINP